MEEKKNRARRIGLIVGIIATVCVAAALLCLFLLSEKDPGGVILNGSKEYAFGDFTFSNVHCINDYVEFQRRTYASPSAQNAAVATAPDGTVYFLAVTANANDRIDTVTLYRMDTEDWTELYSYEIYIDIARQSAGHFLSVFCDVESRVFLFNYTMETNRLEARLYDPKTGECKIVDESRNISFFQTNGRACSDGKKVYFACSSLINPWCNTIVFNFETMEFSISGVGLSGNGLFKELVHRNGKTYLLAYEVQTNVDESGTVKGKFTPVVYCFENYGTDEQLCVFRREIQETDEYGINMSYFSGVRVDNNGNVYVLYTQANLSVEPYYVLEVLSPNGERLYINEYDRVLQTDDRASDMCSFFFGTDGELYILEQAMVSGSQCYVVGRFSGEKHETLEAVTDTIMLDEEVIVWDMQKYSNDPAKDGWITDFICKNSAGEGRYSYMRLRMK